MARAPMVVDAVSGVYPPIPVAEAASHAFDNVNGMTFIPTGNEILVMQNTTVGALTYTIVGVNDEKGRPATLGPISIPAGGFSITGRWRRDAWAQGSGVINVDASGALNYLLIQADVGV